MNSRTLQILRENYIGKVCTIFTKPINRTFDDVRWREHFAIRVEDISTDGIFGRHPYNHTSSFFFMQDIVFIQEEVELDPTNPDHVKMIREYEKQTGKKVVSDLSPHIAPALPEQQAPKAMLPIIQNPADLQEDDPQDGNAVFVNVDILQRLAASTKRVNDVIELTPNRF